MGCQVREESEENILESVDVNGRLLEREELLGGLL